MKQILLYALILGMFGVISSLVGCEKRQVCADYQTSPWPLKSHKGWIVETAHYRIYTTVKDPDFQTAAATLAEDQYTRFCDVMMVRPKEKQTVYIFGDVQQWLAFTELRFGERAGRLTRIRSGGYTAGNFAAFYYLGRYPTLTILAHELFHLYVNLATCPEPVPAWVNEGMACYFEAHEWDECKPVFIPRNNLFRRENLADAVCRKKLFSLRELLATNAGEMGSRPQPKVLLYYAQLWALMQYLEDPCAGEYHAKFQTLLAELGTRKMSLKAKGFLTTVRTSDNVSFGEAVFREYIANDVDAFEADYNAYLPTLVDLE